MKVRSWLVIVFVCILAFCFTGCAPAPAPKDIEKPQSVAEAVQTAQQTGPEEEVIPDYSIEKQAVLDIFTDISSVVRVSGNEAAMQSYLMQWAQSAGLKAEQDESGNIIVDKAADEGFESNPKLILQAHMDYLDFSGQPAESFAVPALRYEGDKLGANASFGASDGLGMALAMQMLVSESCKSGPMRAIFTVSGDSTQAGASALDPARLDADYLINFDGVDAYAIGYGHTGSRLYSYTRTSQYEKNKNKSCYVISVSGLSGGDSGLYVDSGRANAIRVVAECVEKVVNADISVSISEFSGGTNSQVFPSNAYAKICIPSGKEEEFSAIVEEFRNTAVSMYSDVETGFTFEYAKSDDVPAKVLSQEDTTGLLNFLTLSVEGVNTLSTHTEGLAESSSTISYVSVGEEGVKIQKYVRGFSLERFQQMENADQTLCSMCGFSMTMDSEIPGWSTDADNVLLKKAIDIYSDTASDKVSTKMLNTTMELGILAEKRPSMDMIIIGCSLDAVHSNSESADVSTLGDVIYLAYSLAEGPEQ